MKYVVIFWLAATVVAIPSTEKDAFIQIGNDRDGADVVARPATNPTTIGSINEQSNIHNFENQEKDTENLNEKENEEERFEEPVQPNLVNGENLYSNAAIEPEPIVIPGPVYEDTYVPFRRPSIFSGLFSFLPSWITSFPSKWPFKKPFFHRASILYPDYYPEDEIEQMIY
ncbi:uncharacterized protein LOC123689594 [Pieris rapae]|uniref:uncharacterized protein LOC123689594 n=1 Tax=Pieris rapae TaxID=64459 RepID=UPI001E27BAF9|nr:uncharacterized protein LOC123689594 [Pieris rapae]